LLLGGSRALWADGDRLAGRDRFEAAYRLSESEGDAEGLALSALGLSGLWLHEHRTTASAVLAEVRLRRALAAVGPDGPLGLRLRARLAGEADYRTARHASVLAVARETRIAGDPTARLEAAGMAHQCLLGPEHRDLRRALARDVIAVSLETARRGDLLVGLLWRTVDLVLDADPRAGCQLADVKALLARDRHVAVGFVVQAIDVMMSIRAGRLVEAEALAAACAERGRAAGDADAPGWYGTHLLAVRWYQGRVGELLPTVRELAGSPTLSAVDDSHLAGLAVAAAAAGDHRLAAGVLAGLRDGGLARLPRSGTWLLTMYLVAEAANHLRDGETAAAVYDLVLPFAALPVVSGPGVACFGSAHHVLGVASLTTGDATRAVTHLREAVRHNRDLGHGPAATLSRARLALALRLRDDRGDGTDADRELDAATRDAAGLGMTLPEHVRDPAVRLRPRHVACRRRGSRWLVELDDRAAVVDDSVGMGYLAMLFANPDREVPAAELAAGPGLVGAVAADTVVSSSQRILDREAVRAYRQRTVGLRADLDAYRAGGDTVRAARAQEELDWLVAELTAASGLGGRSRTFATSDERARIAVGKAIRRAVRRIEAADPVIGREVRARVTTGLHCCYRTRAAR
jgi:hypothetical protein